MEQNKIIECLRIGLLKHDCVTIDQCIAKLTEQHIKIIEALENETYEQEKAACKYAKVNNLIENLI